MGLLYQAEHQHNPANRVVVKVFHPSVVQDATAYARASMEAEVVSSLEHPHIARILGFDELPGGRPLMVVEHLLGEGLGARLARQTSMPPQQVGRMVEQLGDALQAVHDQDIIHGELKPGYIFLLRDGDPHVKLLNFGISKIRDPQSISRSHAAFGRAYFLSPEQCPGGDGRLGPTTDIFTLGSIAYLALCGELPFEASSLAKYTERITGEKPRPISALLPRLPLQVQPVLEQAMARRREDRFERVSEFAVKLTEALQKEPPAIPGAPARAPAGEPTSGLSPRFKAPPRVRPCGPPPAPVDLSRLVRPLAPAPVPPAATPPAQFEEHATVLMERDQLHNDSPAAAPSQPPGPPPATVVPAPPPRPPADASYLPRKTAIAPPPGTGPPRVVAGRQDPPGAGEQELPVLRDVSESDRVPTTNILGFNELEHADEEDVTDLISLSALLDDDEDEDLILDQDATELAILLPREPADQQPEGQAADFKDTMITPPTRRRDDPFVDADTLEFKDTAISPPAAPPDELQLRDVSEVDDEADTEIHPMSLFDDDDE